MNPETPKNSKLAAAAVAAIVGITLYWTFTYTGPYRYLAELEVKWLGYYVPKLTAMVIILGFLLIAGAIMMAIGVLLAGLFFAIDSYKKRKNAAVIAVQIPA